jgi:hypothetical protein
MSLDTVARFRVTKGEKAKLEERAEGKGVTLSDYLRDVSGLPPSSSAEAGAVPKRSREARRPESAPKPPKPKAKEKADPAKEAVEELAIRLHNREGKTMAVARREARAMLGADD